MPVSPVREAGFAHGDRVYVEHHGPQLLGTVQTGTNPTASTRLTTVLWDGRDAPGVTYTSALLRAAPVYGQDNAVPFPRGATVTLVGRSGPGTVVSRDQCSNHEEAVLWSGCLYPDFYRREQLVLVQPIPEGGTMPARTEQEVLGDTSVVVTIPVPHSQRSREDVFSILGLQRQLMQNADEASWLLHLNQLTEMTRPVDWRVRQGNYIFDEYPTTRVSANKSQSIGFLCVWPSSLFWWPQTTR